MTYKALEVVGLAIIGVVLMASPGVVAAEDLRVVCARDGDCSVSPDNKPLFDEDDLVPGDNYTQNFEVRNERSEACELTFDVDETKQEPNDFSQRIFTVIKEGSKDWYGLGSGSDAAADDKNLDELYGADLIDLGVIEVDSTRNFKWIVTFDREAGNEYQEAETKFDFDLSFECVPEGRVLGVSSSSPGVVAGALFSRFPVTGRNGEARWLAKDGDNWSRVMSGVLAVVLVLYLVFRARRQKRIVE